MFCGLANGNYSDVFVSFGVCYCYNLVFKETQSQKSLFPVSLAIVFCRNGKATENLLSIKKINVVLSKVRLTLCFVPGEHGVL